MKLHVISHKEALDEELLSDKIVVVFDVLLATTTIVACLHHGAEAVIPVKDVEEAREKEKELGENVILAGEWNGKTIEGFLEPSPFVLKNQLKGKRLILSSTNGTRAIRRAMGAKALYIGALLNASALTDWLIEEHADETVLLVCSGSSGRLSLEDFFGAGVFALKLKQKLPSIEFTDAATIACHFAAPQTNKSVNLLKESRVGNMMLEHGMEKELMLAAQIGGYQEIPILVNNELVKKVEGNVLWER